MTERRWPLVVAAVVAAIVIAGAAWAAGRASAPDTPAAGDEAPTGGTTAVRTIDGVPVGVEQSRAGALAAADNYVATVSENVVKDPSLYETLVRRVFAPSEQDYALREGERARTLAPAAVERLRGRWGRVALIGARRLDTYDGSRAQVTTWLGGVVWGPSRRPTSGGSSSRRTFGGMASAGSLSACAQRSGLAPAPAVTKADDTSAYDRATVRARTARDDGTDVRRAVARDAWISAC